MQSIVQPRLYRIEQASAVLGVTHWTLRLWAKRGRIKTLRLGKLLVVPVDEIERIVQKGVEPKTKGHASTWPCK
jgi:excisionase family DNA binding protein